MTNIRIPNQQVIDAIVLNDLDNRELAQIVRQVYRVVEKKSVNETGSIKDAVLNALSVSADSIEEFVS